jgi:hypothetical protein
MNEKEERTSADRVNDALVVTAVALGAIGIGKFAADRVREVRAAYKNRKSTNQK